MPDPASPVVAADRLRDLIRAELPDLIALRHDLHAHPEVGYEEHRTSQAIRSELEKAGVEHIGGLAGGTGVLGHLPGRGERAVGLRADMDALPMTEQTGLEYASTNDGVMHACGHDGHVAILIGAMRVLKRVATEEDLPRPVTFMFQPAEEGGSGGKRMVEEGCLDGSLLGPPIEHAFALHGWPDLGLGQVGTRRGPLLAAADEFVIEVIGTGAHAAFPHLGRDPIVCGSAIVGALQTIASRDTDPLDATVVSVTQFHGGTTHNIIPERVMLEGTVRTLKPETQTMATERLKAIAGDVARAHGCRAEVDYIPGYPVTANSPEAVEIFRTEARAVVDEDQVIDIPQPFMGGEDFAFYCQAVPSCFFLLGLCPPDREAMPNLHQPTFDFNDEAIATGMELFCRLALRS
ncbi:MAG: amidohydrolase [Phycisphaerales bacterium]|nr:MAG: amidohydrolase [Phycisphaerales bacterium]